MVDFFLQQLLDTFDYDLSAGICERVRSPIEVDKQRQVMQRISGTCWRSSGLDY